MCAGPTWTQKSLCTCVVFPRAPPGPTWIQRLLHVCVYVCLSVSVFIYACVCAVSKDASWSHLDSEAPLCVCVCGVSETASWTQRPLHVVCVCFRGSFPVPLDSEAAAWAACRGEAQGSETVSARSQEAGASASKKQSWHRVWVVPESLLKERERGGEEVETFLEGTSPRGPLGLPSQPAGTKMALRPAAHVSAWGPWAWVLAPAVPGQCCCLSKCVFSLGLSLSIKKLRSVVFKSCSLGLFT